MHVVIFHAKRRPEVDAGVVHLAVFCGVSALLHHSFVQLVVVQLPEYLAVVLCVFEMRIAAHDPGHVLGQDQEVDASAAGEFLDLLAAEGNRYALHQVPCLVAGHELLGELNEDELVEVLLEIPSDPVFTELDIDLLPRADHCSCDAKGLEDIPVLLVDHLFLLLFFRTFFLFHNTLNNYLYNVLQRTYYIARIISRITARGISRL